MTAITLENHGLQRLHAVIPAAERHLLTKIVTSQTPRLKVDEALSCRALHAHPLRPERFQAWSNRMPYRRECYEQVPHRSRGLPVDFTVMTDLYHFHDPRVIINGVDRPIAALTNAVAVPGTGQFFAS